MAVVLIPVETARARVRWLNRRKKMKQRRRSTEMFVDHVVVGSC